MAASADAGQQLRQRDVTRTGSRVESVASVEWCTHVRCPGVRSSASTSTSMSTVSRGLAAGDARNMKLACSFAEWFPSFGKESLEATVVPLPDEVAEYLEHGSFLLPAEAQAPSSGPRTWSDGTRVLEEDPQSTEAEAQPAFPEFSRRVQGVLDDYGAVFVKLNWSAPSDAAWVAPTKTLRCTTLEEIYLLLKSSDRVSRDLNDLRSAGSGDARPRPSLVLKKWREINPGTEFRCFVLRGELVGICQRDLSQYYRYIEAEKYDIRGDIKSLFDERIGRGFERLGNYTVDVTRYRKDRVRIIDFGPYLPGTTKTLLFAGEELAGPPDDPPEFRFIGENVAIQPNDAGHFCAPREINEFYESGGSLSPMDVIRRRVEDQRAETRDAGY